MFKKFQILIALVIILSGCSNVEESTFGGDIIEKDAKEIEKEILKIEQDQEKEKTGKYKQIKEYEKETVKYLIDKYKTPKGEEGYQIVINDGKTKKSIGYGPEAESRTWERTYSENEFQLEIIDLTK